MEDEGAARVLGDVEERLAALEFHAPLGFGDAPGQRGVGVELDLRAVSERDLALLSACGGVRVGIDRGSRAERENETVRMDRTSSLMAIAKARVWASEGWDVTIIVGEENEIAPPDARTLLFA